MKNSEKNFQPSLKIFDPVWVDREILICLILFEVLRYGQPQKFTVECVLPLVIIFL